jgi:predicted methyltransferase
VYNRQPPDPDISLVTHGGEVTLLIDGIQAMQGWESSLMRRAADLLTARGSCFLEAGLGLGLSALRIAGQPATRAHVVVEKYPKVIEIFRSEHPIIPDNLEIVHADFFDYLERLPEMSLDGVFFDPELPRAFFENKEFVDGFMPKITAALRPGGAFVPMFSVDGIVPDAATCTAPPGLILERYMRFFARVTVERHPYTAYQNTRYTPGVAGEAFIFCFYR